MTPAEQLLSQLDQLQERRGDLARGMVTLGGSSVIQGLVRQVTQRYHNLQGDVNRFRMKKKEIRRSAKSKEQKKHEIDALEKQFAQQLGAKIRQQRDRARQIRGKAGHVITKRRDLRTARRALHGNPFGW